MARSNLYVVTMSYPKCDYMATECFFFYNRRSAVSFIKKSDHCFISLEVYFPDCSGMYHLKVLPLCPQNS